MRASPGDIAVMHLFKGVIVRKQSLLYIYLSLKVQSCPICSFPWFFSKAHFCLPKTFSFGL